MSTCMRYRAFLPQLVVNFGSFRSYWWRMKWSLEVPFCWEFSSHKRLKKAFVSLHLLLCLGSVSFYWFGHILVSILMKRKMVSGVSKKWHQASTFERWGRMPVCFPLPPYPAYTRAQAHYLIVFFTCNVPHDHLVSTRIYGKMYLPGSSSGE